VFIVKFPVIVVVYFATSLLNKDEDEIIKKSAQTVQYAESYIYRPTLTGEGFFLNRLLFFHVFYVLTLKNIFLRHFTPMPRTFASHISAPYFGHRVHFPPPPHECLHDRMEALRHMGRGNVM